MRPGDCVHCGVTLDVDEAEGRCERCRAAERIAEYNRRGEVDPEIAARMAALEMPRTAQWGWVWLWRTHEDEIECGVLSSTGNVRIVIRPTQDWAALVAGYTVELFGRDLPTPDAPNAWRVEWHLGAGLRAAFAFQPWQRLAQRTGSRVRVETRWHPEREGSFHIQGPTGGRRPRGALADAEQALKLLGALPAAAQGAPSKQASITLEMVLRAYHECLPLWGVPRVEDVAGYLSDIGGPDVSESTLQRWLTHHARRWPASDWPEYEARYGGPTPARRRSRREF